jgi:uncharacterized protein YPO0396
MTTKRVAIGAGVAVVVLGVVYLLGYWPERQRRVALERDAAAQQTRVVELDARVRAARLLGDLLHVTDAAAAMNYGVARELSSAFFDEAREEAARTPDPDLRAALEQIGQRRDAVTTALARGDPRVVETLRELEIEFREALGYPTGFRPPPPAPAGASRTAP